MICINGKQMTPSGQSGIYFICQHGQYKGNHCRWSRWCSDSRSYISATDKYGNVCPDFSITEIAEQQEVIDQRIKEILENPCTKSLELEKPIEKTIEEPIEKTVEEAIEEPIEETIEETVEETIEEPVEETVEEIVEKSTGGEIVEKSTVGEISNKVIESIVDAIVDELIKQPVVKTVDESFEYHVIEPLNNE